MLPNNWSSLTPDEKFEARFAQWMSTEGKPFASPAATQRYQRRAQRVKDIVQLKKPDRVPCLAMVMGFVAQYSGITPGDMMYDYEKATQAILKFSQDFQPDYVRVGSFLPGRVYDKLGYQVYQWPKNGLSMEMPFQMVEGEYMLADEYDLLIADPEGFYMRVYMPRVFKALEGWRMLPSFFTSYEIPTVPLMMAPVGLPAVQGAFQAYLEAGRAAGEWLGAFAKVGGQLMGKLGMPQFMGGWTKAPFDIVGDTLRGTRGIMGDMYRQPDRLLAALERMVPIAIRLGVESTTRAQHPLVFIPLHKGADGFMSTENYARFYWPSFKAVLQGLIDEGIVPFSVADGSYEQRLDLIAEAGLPAGKTLWGFDQTDMLAVKERFGSWAAIGGNVPASLFHAGTPQQIEDCARNLIDTVGRDGGYLLMPGAAIDVAQPENVQAFINVAREYGRYR